MKTIKETIIGVFAVIGFVAIVSGFTTNNATQDHTAIESHVWEGLNDDAGDAYIFNKVTGEARYFHATPKVNEGYTLLKPKK